MEGPESVPAQLSQPLVLWIAGLALAVVIFIIVVESVRRRRVRGLLPRDIRSPQSNVFRRIANNYRALRQELKERNAEKAWRHNFEKSKERNAEKGQHRDPDK